MEKLKQRSVRIYSLALAHKKVSAVVIAIIILLIVLN